MGSFSWTRAEHTTKRSNFTIGDNYKILIPKEFGGGYIKDTYFDYGNVFIDKTSFEHNNKKRCVGEYVDGNGIHYSMNVFVNNSNCCNYKDNRQCYCDLYGIIAWMNDCEDLKYFGNIKSTTMYEILKNGLTWYDDNRCKGIDIGCYDNQVDTLKYPLKLVSASYKGTYEDCKGRSYGDPEQGFGSNTWDSSIWFGESYTKYLNKLIELEIS